MFLIRHSDRFDWKFRLEKVAVISAFGLLGCVPLHYVQEHKHSSDDVSEKLKLTIASQKEEAAAVKLLLKNVLPEEITKVIIESGATVAEEFSQCTIMFACLKNFESFCSSPQVVFFQYRLLSVEDWCAATCVRSALMFSCACKE